MRLAKVLLRMGDLLWSHRSSRSWKQYSPLMVMLELWKTCLGGFRSSPLNYSHEIGVHALGHQLFEQGGEMGRRFGEFDDCAASRSHCTKLT